ncbi:hypothetical protein F4808DRAFT_437863 [Astrocystis sublimbata]|nr:hypothetical protein F4808DRAFT_437863 [Astrocystis sublimbata]
MASTMQEPTLDEIQLQPWRYISYKRYAEFLSSDGDLLIFRRFGALNARIGLLLQDRVSELEERLAALEKEYSRDSDPINSGSLRDDMPERQDLLNEITCQLSQYNAFLIQQTQLREYVRAPRRDVKNLRRWHDNYDRRAIDEEEQRYLEHNQDLIRLKSINKTPVRNWLDNSLVLRTLSIWQKKSRPVPGYEANNVSYYSNTSMDAFASLVIVSIGASLLIIPLWILQTIENLQVKLAVITSFVLLFLLVLSFILVSKPFEALGATAAYAAVLMVFLQVS